MANICNTEYKVTGTRKAVVNLWETLQELRVNSISVPLSRVANHYGIDYEHSGISVRGYIYWAELDNDGENAILSFDTNSAWSSCDLFFEEVNKALGNELSISWREVEPGCGIYFTHDEHDFFTEQCYVIANGDLFEDCEGPYETFNDAIDKWCEKTGYSRNGKTEKEMLELIDDYEYEDDGVSFSINEITFE